MSVNVFKCKAFEKDRFTRVARNMVAVGIINYNTSNMLNIETRTVVHGNVKNSFENTQIILLFVHTEFKNLNARAHKKLRVRKSE